MTTRTLGGLLDARRIAYIFVAWGWTDRYDRITRQPTVW